MRLALPWRYLKHLKLSSLEHKIGMYSSVLGPRIRNIDISCGTRSWNAWQRWRSVWFVPAREVYLRSWFSRRGQIVRWESASLGMGALSECVACLPQASRLGIMWNGYGFHQHPDGGIPTSAHGFEGGATLKSPSAGFFKGLPTRYRVLFPKSYDSCLMISFLFSTVEGLLTFEAAKRAPAPPLFSPTLKREQPHRSVKVKKPLSKSFPFWCPFLSFVLTNYKPCQFLGSQVKPKVQILSSSYNTLLRTNINTWALYPLSTIKAHH